ncbi:hypothetical protein [Arthrobacter wenxiniae]|uniref:Uncharacterized protein n=1 Tax=Arthrobacter wenxiniae TaxID=2713570 RepID=A0A7Y7IGD2_9MICC|nr:hypothetical protein [Arthrobacter wenxiniae]NVM94937.1 hypothetical protein [Arthrobacter wenxiniae]
MRDHQEALRPYAEAGGYINFMDADDQHRIQANDPGNVFHLNQDIVPAEPALSHQ